MDDDSRFMAWFEPWKEARPDMVPVGWYVLADLQAAFLAGQATALDKLIADLRKRPE